MAVRMTKDAVTQASLLMICWIAFLVGPPVAEVTAQSAPNPQTEMQPEPVAAAPESAAVDGIGNSVPPPPAIAMFWIAAAVSLLLIGVSSGAIAAVVVIRSHRAAHAAAEIEPDESTPAPGETRPPARRFAHGIQVSLLAMRIQFKRRLHHAAVAARCRLRRLIPSRRTVLRYGCLLGGAALVILSLLGFTTGRVLESSILLPVGYAIATCFWLIPWKRAAEGPDAEEVAYLARGLSPFAESSEQKATVPLSASASAHTTPPPPHVSFTADTVDNLPALSAADTVENVPAATAFQPSNPVPPGYAALLRCAPCGKHFNVRGQGEIAFRLVPCPDCGSAMESLGANRPSIIPADPNWVPIVSVFCKSCRSLIDVPYSTFGTSIPCPRCQASLPVPHVSHSHSRDLAQSDLAPA